VIINITQKFLESIRLPLKDSLRYLIVIPRFVNENNLSYQFPTGFAMVSSALKASGREVFTLNLNYKDNHQELLKNTIINNKIDVVLTGGLSGHYTVLHEIIYTAKSVSPDIITVCGGGIITADPVVAMKALETADYGVIGEGEITVNDLAFALENDEEVKNVSGIVTKDGYITKPRPEIADLDSLPFPDYEGFEFELTFSSDKTSTDALAIETTNIVISRSCPYQCTFCFHTSGQKYRKRSIDNVFSEIDWLIEKYGITNFTFADELFISDKRFFSAFCERIKPYNLKWWAQSRVDTVNDDILQKMKDAGCYTISYGVESADDKILKSMRKNITAKQIEAAFESAKRVGLECYGNFIFGDNEETEETIANSLNFKNLHPDYNIRIVWILTFPGSFLYKTAVKNGIIKDPVQYLKDGCPQINVSKMSDEDYWNMVSKVELWKIMFNLGQTPDILKIDMKKSKKSLDNILNFGKVAIWPATVRSIEMLSEISEDFVKSSEVIFVNLDPKNQWVNGIADKFGKKVFLPSIIDEMVIKTVLYPYESVNVIDIFSQISNMIDRDFKNVTRIIKIGDILLDNKDGILEE
jgi:radical SAM superfamily enzyme YgiQ (UPF0313 family)